MSRVRVRQHVNPLSQKYQTPIAAPPWEKIYADFFQPLHLDIGCARGKFLLTMAEKYPDWNFLGVEIREPLVIEANEQGRSLGLTNLHFLFGNINVEPLNFLRSLPQAPGRVSIQFPDPWFKTRHSKRRVVQPELVQALADVLAPGSLVFLQSDVALVAREMAAQFENQPEFKPLTRGDNPWGVPTEREIACQRLGRLVYRRLLERR
ncbi:MAG: tRNA (guanosine(46)-N7)-methyltransferase TrmB [Cyanobacteria bacterium RI_101]|nr:tRNA (guanosine(46)-N7)-methyltransferase TrmB [Cyanobacteria bacterium RI_101]